MKQKGIWGTIPILKGSWRVWVSIHATSHSMGIWKTIYLILSDYWQTYTLWIPGCCMLQRLLVVQPCVPNILIDWKQSSRVQCINVMLIQLACLLLILYFDTFTQARQVPTKIVLLPNDSSTIIYHSNCMQVYAIVYMFMGANGASIFRGLSPPRWRRWDLRSGRSGWPTWRSPRLGHCWISQFVSIMIITSPFKGDVSKMYATF